MPLIDRFSDDAGRGRLFDALTTCKPIDGSAELAAQVADRAQLISVAPGTTLIEQTADDNDVYLILAGTADLLVNGRPVQVRSAGDHVGEMAAILPSQLRSASIVPGGVRTALAATGAMASVRSPPRKPAPWLRSRRRHKRSPARRAASDRRSPRMRMK